MIAHIVYTETGAFFRVFNVDMGTHIDYKISQKDLRVFLDGDYYVKCPPPLYVRRCIMKGSLLFTGFDGQIIFRVYDSISKNFKGYKPKRKFTDYKVKVDDLPVEILSKYYVLDDEKKELVYKRSVK
jgi:hypothetical protein